MKLTSNESTPDRIIRIALGIGLTWISLAAGVVGPLLVGIWVVSAVLVATGIVGFCPLYATLRISTRRTAR